LSGIQHADRYIYIYIYIPNSEDDGNLDDSGEEQVDLVGPIQTSGTFFSSKQFPGSLGE
jgi:hypothetical protein